jgi:FMN phosphatase YigB (HAD superfamily)
MTVLRQRRWVVFDIDGTVSDASHRQQLAQAKEWDQFHSLAAEDKVIVPVANLVRVLSGTAQVMFLTGRPEKFRFATEKWLHDSGLEFYYDHLLMRDDGDFLTKDIDMKVAKLEKFFGNKFNVLHQVWMVLDDRQQVVEGLRNYGLTVLQPAASSY